MMNFWCFLIFGDCYWVFGLDFEDWSGMGIVWFYILGDLDVEYMVICIKVGFMDVLGLKKVYVIGFVVSYVIECVMMWNMEKLMLGCLVYVCMLNDVGKFVDDCVIYCIGLNVFMVVYGLGQGFEQLIMVVYGCDVLVWFDDNLYDLLL